MRAALTELEAQDSEHPNTWLSDDDGWTIEIYESGLVILRDHTMSFASVVELREMRHSIFGSCFSKEREMRSGGD